MASASSAWDASTEPGHGGEHQQRDEFAAEGVSHGDLLRWRVRCGPGWGTFTARRKNLDAGTGTSVPRRSDGLPHPRHHLMIHRGPPRGQRSGPRPTLGLDHDIPLLRASIFTSGIVNWVACPRPRGHGVPRQRVGPVPVLRRPGRDGIPCPRGRGHATRNVSTPGARVMFEAVRGYPESPRSGRQCSSLGRQPQDEGTRKR